MISFSFDGFVIEDPTDGSPEGDLVAWTREEPREQIGRFEFSSIDEQNERHILVTWMHLEGPGSSRAYIRRGIGNRIIDIKRGQGCTVFFRYQDGVKHDDGSYLTDLGLPFATKLVEARKARWLGHPGNEWDD